MGERDGRKLRGVQYLVRVGIANSADKARVGKRSFERAIFECQCSAKSIEIRCEDFNAAGIYRLQTLFAAE